MCILKANLKKWKPNTHTHMHTYKIEWIDKTPRQVVEATSKETHIHKEKKEQEELKNKTKTEIEK